MYDLEKLILGVEMYVIKRQLGIAEAMAQEFSNACSQSVFKESGYAILAVVSSYFEMIEQFSVGRPSAPGESKAFFIQGFRKVYPSTILTNPQIGEVYGLVRCGMYHGGMTKFGVEISRYFPSGVTYVSGKIHISPAKVVEELSQHFQAYIQTLRDPASVLQREHFQCHCGFDT